jgi:hypothetical protein
MDIRSTLGHLWGLRYLSQHMARGTVMDKAKLDLVIDKSRSRKWSGIVWHHSASPDGQTRDWPGIVRYHTSPRIDFEIVSPDDYERRLKIHDGKVFQPAWKCVGYHGGTEWVDGKVVFTWGRPLDQIGAHAGVKGCSNLFNTEYLGLVAIGNFDAKPPAPEHWEFNLQVTRAFMKAFDISAGRVIGHREVFTKLNVPVQKSCPGRSWSMDSFRSCLQLLALLAVKVATWC